MRGSLALISVHRSGHVLALRSNWLLFTSCWSGSWRRSRSLYRHSWRYLCWCTKPGCLHIPIFPPVLSEIHRWAMNCSRSLAILIVSTIIPPKGIYSNHTYRPILMEDHKIALERSFQNLGVTFNVNRSWMPHLNGIQGSAEMSHPSTANWGRGRKFVRCFTLL